MTVIACEGARVALQVTGAIAPVLKAIAEHDPVDLISRPADLDELFLDLYREPSAGAGRCGLISHASTSRAGAGA